MRERHWDREANEWTKESEAGANDALEVVKYLLENGASVNSSYEDYDWRGCGSKETAFEKALAISTSYPDTFGPDLLAMFLKVWTVSMISS